MQPPQNFGITMAWCRTLGRILNLHPSGFPIRRAGALKGTPLLSLNPPGEKGDQETLNERDGRGRLGLRQGLEGLRNERCSGGVTSPGAAGGKTVAGPRQVGNPKNPALRIGGTGVQV